MDPLDFALSFFENLMTGAASISSERGLQLELALWLRNQGFEVRFEAPQRVSKSPLQSKPQKRIVDLWISKSGDSFALELKVPLAGRVPETMFDYFADIAFVEALVREKRCAAGACVLLTNDSNYWHGRTADGIYRHFRRSDSTVTGAIAKPTGSRETTVHLSGAYRFNWRDMADHRILPEAKYIKARIG